jgi:hypothetical protein
MRRNPVVKKIVLEERHETKLSRAKFVSSILAKYLNSEIFIIQINIRLPGVILWAM